MTTVPTIKLNNGVAIPQLGFGVWRVSSAEIVPTLEQAVEVGYRHIDTAKLYANEEGVGKVVRDSGLPREDFFLTTKLWNDDHAAGRVQEAFDTSLERLGLDYVDLYLIHWPLPATDRYVQVWRDLEEIAASGRARAIGVSNFTEEHLRRLVAETDTVPAVNQVEMHPTLAQDELRAVHAELGIATQGWAPIAKGRDLALDPVPAIAEEVGKTPAQVVIRWHLQRGDIVFPKTVTPERIVENFDVFDFELTDEQVAAITALDRGNRIGLAPEAVTA